MKIQPIIRAVCEVYQVTEKQLRGRVRTEQVATARQAAMALAYELTPFGSTEVGKVFKRDHATVLWAVKATDKRAVTDGNCAKWLNQVRARLEGWREHE